MRLLKFAFFLCVATCISVYASESNTPKLFITSKSTISSSYSEASFIFEDSPAHAKGYSATGDFSVSGQIRIRGNSTATAPKKPYNIKFEKKINMFGMGKNKKWALLSNPFDPTLIRNKLIFDLAGKLPFDFSPKSYFIDVWVNNEFQGNYLLAQNVEFHESRINLSAENDDFLFEYVQSRKKSNITYIYSPLDSFRLALEEPSEPTKDQLKVLENKLYSIEQSINTQDISEYIQFVDLQSMIDYYWIEEFVHDPDLHTGSTYFTIHKGILRGGPVWDFDLSLGNTKSEIKAKTTGMHGKLIWWEKLFQDPSFQKIAYERYLELAPYFENLAKDNRLGNNQIDSILLNFKDSFDRNFSDSGWVNCDSTAKSSSKIRRLTCPYNPQPKADFEDNIEDLRQWILDRNTYLKSKAKQALEDLDSITISFDEILKEQIFIFKTVESTQSINPNPLSRYGISFIPTNKTNRYLRKRIAGHSSIENRKGFLVNGTKTQSNASKITIKK